MANQPLAFGALVVGGILFEAGIKGKSVTSVVTGTAGPMPSTPTSTITTPAVNLGTLGFGAGASTAAGVTSVATGDNPRGTSIVPAAVINAFNRARGLIGTPYKYGGGHDAAALTESVAAIKASTGIDCSGFVSNVLGPDGAGILSSVQDTATLPSASDIEPGAGSYITVYDRASGSQAHTILSIMGQFFESGGNTTDNPKGGVVALTAAEAKAELAGGGFVQYHPKGL
jgi:hypothetical protein